MKLHENIAEIVVDTVFSGGLFAYSAERALNGSLGQASIAFLFASAAAMTARDYAKPKEQAATQSAPAPQA